MTIVMPLGKLTDHIQHLGDSTGSSALVTSSRSSIGLHRERTHDRDALLLAPGEPVRDTRRPCLEPEAAEQVDPRLVLRLVAREAQHLARRQRHVPQHASCAGRG